MDEGDEIEGALAAFDEAAFLSRWRYFLRWRLVLGGAAPFPAQVSCGGEDGDGYNPTPMKAFPRAFPLDRPQIAALSVLGWALLVAISGRFEVPFVPVPLTLQTLAAMGAGVALGSRRGAAAVGLTLLLGAGGLPAFSGGGAGIAHLVGPTGGYLWALPLLAAGYGFAAKRLWLAPLVSLGHLLLGAAWLAAFVGAERALVVGVVPFLLGEAVKGLIALAAARALRAR